MPLTFPHGVVANTRRQRLGMISTKVVREKLRLHPVLLFERRIGWAMFVQRKEWINVEFAAVGEGANYNLLSIVEIIVSAERALTGSCVKPAAPYEHRHARRFDLRAQTEGRNLGQIDRPFGCLNIVVSKLGRAHTVNQGRVLSLR